MRGKTVHDTLNGLQMFDAAHSPRQRISYVPAPPRTYGPTDPMSTEADGRPTQVKLEAVAVKLWNEAKRESKAKARPK